MKKYRFLWPLVGLLDIACGLIIVAFGQAVIGYAVAIAGLVCMATETFI